MCGGIGGDCGHWLPYSADLLLAWLSRSFFCIKSVCSPGIAARCLFRLRSLSCLLYASFLSGDSLERQQANASRFACRQNALFAASLAACADANTPLSFAPWSKDIAFRFMIYAGVSDDGLPKARALINNHAYIFCLLLRSSCSKLSPRAHRMVELSLSLS